MRCACASKLGCWLMTRWAWAAAWSSGVTYGGPPRTVPSQLPSSLPSGGTVVVPPLTKYMKTPLKKSIAAASSPFFAFMMNPTTSAKSSRCTAELGKLEGLHVRCATFACEMLAAPPPDDAVLALDAPDAALLRPGTGAGPNGAGLGVVGLTMAALVSNGDGAVEPTLLLLLLLTFAALTLVPPA